MPTENVTIVPTKTYQVHAKGVNRATPSMNANPTAKPTSAPFSFARRFHVPSKNTPSIAPYVIDVIVRPATNTGPQ